VAQVPVHVEVGAVELRAEPLREHDLECIAVPDVATGCVDRSLEVLA
jgi:hypothetical protein